MSSVNALESLPVANKEKVLIVDDDIPCGACCFAQGARGNVTLQGTRSNPLGTMSNRPQVNSSGRPSETSCTRARGGR